MHQPSATSDADEPLLTSADAARMLGVRVETLYAYVSRGLIEPVTRGGAGRGSRFARRDIVHLLRGQRAGAGRQPITVTTAISTLDEDRPHFRGYDAFDLARRQSFERTAELLWDVESDPAASWTAPKAALHIARGAIGALPPTTPPVHALAIGVLALGTADPLRSHVAPTGVTRMGRTMIAGSVALLDPHANRALDPTRPIAAQLLTALGRGRVTEPDVKFVDQLLTILADHQLAVGTMTVRAAASARIDPYGCVATGLGTLRSPNPTHLGDLRRSEHLVDLVARSGSPEPVLGDYLERGERIPGAGHPAYPRGDARVEFILDGLRRIRPRHRHTLAAENLVAALPRLGLEPANVDLAVAAATRALGLRRGSAEAVFAISRMAGWVAHALEEYADPSRFRARPVYVGVPIRDAPDRRD